MAREEGKEEEKFDFTAEGESFGYISLDQASILAMQTARETPGAYGPGFSETQMAFDVVEANETEDYYEVTLSYRPQGAFTGPPGQEQFFIEKEGAVAHRQVLSVPGGGRRFPVVPVGAAVVVWGIIGGLAVAFALVGDDGSTALSLEPTVVPSGTVPIPCSPGSSAGCDPLSWRRALKLGHLAV